MQIRHIIFTTSLFIALMLAAVPTLASEPKYMIRIASLAPAGSSWMNSFEATNREVRAATNGEVGFQIYGGGVMGDESAMVRRMRSGQLDGGALTSVGLGEIESQLLVLQLPLVFRSEAELDYVRDQMSDTFEKLLADKGFVLLHWGDVGFNYVFSNSPVASPSDIASTKMWAWDADPISRQVMEVAGVNATLLGVPDVLPSLSTGLIDAFSNSPYGAVALQWHSRAKYVTNLRLAVVIGGLVVTKSTWEKLPEEHRKTVMEIARKNGQSLMTQIRRDNNNAMNTITRAGIEVVRPADMDAWMDLARQTREALTGRLFPKALVDEMLRHLAQHRRR